MRRLLALALALCSPLPALAACPSEGVHVQVLGSGGPAPDVGARASSGYLVWVDGKARVLIDAGGGTFLRFAEAGARLMDLEAIALTHLHTDHASELAAFMKAGYFIPRKRPLWLGGPDEGGRGGRHFPGLAAHVRALFDGQTGAFRYLSGHLEAGSGDFPLEVTPLPAKKGARGVLYDRGGLKIESVGVEHGPVPAVGYRVTVGGKRFVFSGDQNGDNPAFAELARGADVLVVTHAIPEEAPARAKALHMTPSQIGRLAGSAKVGRLVLSHFMRRSLARLDVSEGQVRAHYSGPVVRAADLMCLTAR